MEHSGIVYCITNNINGKQYVGITGRSLDQRFAEHCKVDSYIGKAIRKNGAENFSIREIDCAYSKEDLMEKEIAWIKRFDTFGKGYNLTIGGEGVRRLQRLDVTLTDKQSKFLRFVNKENAKPIDVRNANAMARMTIMNVICLYLTANYESEKKQTAKMIMKYKEQFRREIFRLNLFTEEEVNGFAVR